jgi:hypothetical protein
MGVEVGKGTEEEAFGMPNPCKEHVPVIGVGVECR